MESIDWAEILKFAIHAIVIIGVIRFDISRLNERIADGIARSDKRIDDSIVRSDKRIEDSIARSDKRIEDSIRANKEQFQAFLEGWRAKGD